ncbi:sensor histidine kinase [Halioxenophilus aromaticivorans]|uniref:histidine kinase n=1 Tax=Halioxenophilus aromaticivorans TaxID=1306992 RepID=A0AAV3U3P6_9ALTE
MATNYLQTELYKLFKTDSTVVDFIEQGSLDGLWYWDLENPEHEWMSPRFWLTMGIDPSTKQHLSAEWQDLIHPQDLETALSNFEKHCADPNHPYDQYVRYKHVSGKWVWVRCRGIVLRDGSGKPIRMLGAHTDVTEIMEARETERWAKQLQQVNEDLTTLSYAASHDLKAPLRSLVGLIDILKQEYAIDHSADTQAVFPLIDQQLENMQRLLDSVQDLSSIESASQSVVAKEFNLATVVDQVKKDLQFSEIDQAWRVEFNGEQNLRGDRVLIYRCFLNIFQNSMKYASPDTALTITVQNRKLPEGYQVSVTDNGVGLAKEHCQKMFDYFSKFHDSAQYAGTGLGLAIVRRVMTLHGGKVTASSEVGQGMRIELLFPVLV